jgi:hypothetical protein
VIKNRMFRKITVVGVVVAALGFGGGLVGPAQAAPDDTYTIAVIGDVPYGDPLIAHFPAFISQINADPDVRMVTHLGDIKNGSTVCSDQYFDLIYQDFAQFRRPLVYTPGDNEVDGLPPR